MIAAIPAIALCLSQFAQPNRSAWSATAATSPAKTAAKSKATPGAAAAGSIALRFEDLEGAILLPIELRGVDRDTSGVALLDTGAGYLALDRVVAARLGLTSGGSGSAALEILDRALPGARIGQLEIRDESPTLQLDLAPFRRVTDRPLVALLGQHALDGRAIVLDYRTQDLIIVTPTSPGPAGSSPVAASRRLLGRWLGRGARPVPFELRGDGKIMLRGSISGSVDTLNWVLDTGATKTIVFSGAWMAAESEAESWPTLTGLHAPTVLGDAEARVVRVPELAVFGADGSVGARRVDCARLGGQLEAALSRTAGAPVHGLLGYSFLRRFRFAVDYAHSVLWLEPVDVGEDARPFEYTTIGVQLERSDDAIRVVAVADDSPAATAGVQAGDVVRSIDDRPAAKLPLTEAGRMLEGKAGSVVGLEVERGGETLRFRIARRRLL